jgi:hypothetical protein
MAFRHSEPNALPGKPKNPFVTLRDLPAQQAERVTP